ncbi:uncharacterized protein LOC117330992 [Pecten maximus]|uniref:uncharacterized protein LOC117330992 n=1 Tax=Pecten maximus TaxID=6579 RepID=UPI001458BCB7|nr:uncharacterized protein LOC117330992 [Pecten maximus]
MITETGKLRVRMAHDEIFHCHILVFATGNKHNYQGESIRVDCVENKQVEETIEKLRHNSYGFVELTKCRSPPIFIEDGERIRISLRGGMKLPVGFRKDQMIITFLREGFHKHIVFPVETHFGNRPTSLGYLDFNRMDGQKEMIYETFFDVDFPFKKMALDANSVSPSPTPFGSGFHLTSPRQASSPEDQPSTPPYIMDKIIGTLTNMLPPNEWKFILRAIIDDSCVEADNIISEAELNNKGNVKEAIYQSLRTWAQKTNLSSPNQKFDAIIQGLENENYVEIASRLKAQYERDGI